MILLIDLEHFSDADNQARHIDLYGGRAGAHAREHDKNGGAHGAASMALIHGARLFSSSWHWAILARAP
jgi:hypothetical protein